MNSLIEAYLGESPKLASGMRSKANAALMKSGFDGNGRFRSQGHGISSAFDVLSKFGIVVDGHVDGFRVSKPSGSIKIDVAFSDENASSPFDPPASIPNSALSFSWHELENGKFEVVAYLS